MSPVPQTVIDQIAATNGVVESATLLITTFAARITTAVSEALANGATAAELAPVTAAVADLKAKSDVLSAAVAANP